MKKLQLTLVLTLSTMMSIFAQGGDSNTTPILVWVGSILGIIWAAWTLFGQITKLTKTEKDDEIYEKGKEFYDKIPQIFKTSSGEELVRKRKK